MIVSYTCVTWQQLANMNKWSVIGLQIFCNCRGDLIGKFQHNSDFQHTLGRVPILWRRWCIIQDNNDRRWTDCRILPSWEFVSQSCERHFVSMPEITCILIIRRVICTISSIQNKSTTFINCCCVKSLSGENIGHA